MARPGDPTWKGRRKGKDVEYRFCRGRRRAKGRGRDARGRRDDRDGNRECHQHLCRKRWRRIRGMPRAIPFAQKARPCSDNSDRRYWRHRADLQIPPSRYIRGLCQWCEQRHRHFRDQIARSWRSVRSPKALDGRLPGEPPKRDRQNRRRRKTRSRENQGGVDFQAVTLVWRAQRIHRSER